MMVIFISQCEKKALPKTRRVLDAFANRIGHNTWQTNITKEGLLALKKLLRKTASKIQPSVAIGLGGVNEVSWNGLLVIVKNLIEKAMSP